MNMLNKTAFLFICAGTLFAQSAYFDDIKEHKKRFVENLPPESPQFPAARIRLTVSCDDADLIPKVADAGKLFEDESGPYQLMHNGIKVVKDGYCGKWMTDLIYGLKGHHEPQEEKVFHEVLKYIPPEGVMIELGSYWAYYSLWFSFAVPEAQNYMIEPDPQFMKIGQKNFALNHKKGFFYRGYAAIKGNDQVDYQGARPIFIDAFLEEEGISHVSILHADIQGAEYEMLKSCVKSMETKKIDFFFISTHGDGLHYMCWKFLQEHGYAIIAEHAPSESYSVDGLIVAKRIGIAAPEEVLIAKLR
jgi:hypothetical protein